MVTRLVGNASITTEGAASEKVITAGEHLKFANASDITTGAPVLLTDINDYLTGGMLTLGAIAVAIMIVILLVLFDVRWRLLPLAVILIGIVWAFGLAGYLGIPLTIVTIAGLPVLLGIGIDYAIQMHARVEEEVVIDRAEHPIQETARNLCPALLVVTFDAIFAFAALRFAKVPMLRQFGLLLAVGIAVICLCSIIAPLAALGIREYKSPTKGRDFRTGPLGRLVVWLGALPGGVAIPLAVASVIIFAGGILVEGQLELQTDPIKWVNQDSQVIHDLHTLDRETGSSSELGMFVQSKDVFDDKTVGFMDNFTTEELAKHPDTLLTGAGIVTTVSDITNDVPGASHVAPTGEEVRAADGVAPEGVKKSTVSSNGDALNLVFRTGPSELAAAGRGRARDPVHRQSPGGRQRDPVGPGRGRRRLARQPRGQPRPAHVPRHPLRVPLPVGAAPQRDPLAALARPGADRGGHRVARRLRLQPQAEPHHRGGRPVGGRRMHGVHVADPAALRGGTPARADARGGGRGRRVAHRVGRSSCRPSPRSPAWPSSQRRRCHCCGTSASSWR